jgi:hypothetical protein
MSKWSLSLLRLYCMTDLRGNARLIVNLWASAALASVFVLCWQWGFHRHHQTVDTLDSVILAGAFVGGTLLISIVTNDLSIKALAKYKLSMYVAALSPGERDYLFWIVSRGQSAFLYRDWPLHPFEDWPRRVSENNEVASAENAWIRLISFLQEDQLGTEAANALFQRSRVGRERYFKSTLRSAEDRRALI